MHSTEDRFLDGTYPELPEVEQIPADELGGYVYLGGFKWNAKFGEVFVRFGPKAEHYYTGAFDYHGTFKIDKDFVQFTVNVNTPPPVTNWSFKGNHFPQYGCSKSYDFKIYYSVDEEPNDLAERIEEELAYAIKQEIENKALADAHDEEVISEAKPVAPTVDELIFGKNIETKKSKFWGRVK